MADPSLRPPKGTDDILPPASRTWRRVLRVWDDWAERFGYELAMTPLFEATDLFERGVGESTEIVRKQILYDQQEVTRLSFEQPEDLKKLLIAGVKAYLGEDFDVEKHFTPRYRPWRQRIAFVPDGDLFQGIASGKASVVTDEIERFKPENLPPGHLETQKNQGHAQKIEHAVPLSAGGNRAGEDGAAAGDR